MSEMKNILDEINGRSDTAKKNISELEATEIASTENVKEREKVFFFPMEKSSNKLWKNLKQHNTCVIGVSEEERA